MGIFSWFVKREYKSPDLKDLIGVYRGFAPIIKSSSAKKLEMGELEVSISLELVESRFAAGLETWENQIPTSEFNKMSRKELCGILGEKNGVPDRVAGFKVREYKYFFTLDPRDDSGLIIQSGMPGRLGRAILYNPKQVWKGMYNQEVAKIEKEYGAGSFVRISPGGRVLQ